MLTKTDKAQIVYALQKLLETYSHDLDTGYDGDPNFGPDDVAFLTHEIKKTQTALAHLT